MEHRGGDAEGNGLGRQRVTAPSLSPWTVLLTGSSCSGFEQSFFSAAGRSELPSRNIWEDLLSSPLAVLRVRTGEGSSWSCSGMLRGGRFGVCPMIPLHIKGG